MYVPDSSHAILFQADSCSSSTSKLKLFSSRHQLITPKDTIPQLVSCPMPSCGLADGNRGLLPKTMYHRRGGCIARCTRYRRSGGIWSYARAVHENRYVLWLLALWLFGIVDTSGEGFLLVYSITSRSSFEEVSTFHQQILRVSSGFYLLPLSK